MIVIDGVEMVDVHEAADLAGRTPETIRRWVWSGRLRSVKHGNKHFIPRDQVAPARAAEAAGTDPTSVSFAAWAAEAVAAMTGRTDATAADLVIEDRQSDARR